MTAVPTRFVALGMAPELAKEVATQIDDNLPVEAGSIVNADINAAAAIATTKLADGTVLATLVAADTEILALSASDLVTAVGTPATYSEVPADIAAALVAAGIMAAE